MSTAERLDDFRSQADRGRSPGSDDGNESPTQDSRSDQAELLRRAIRAVARAQRLIAETEDSQRRREADRAQRAAERDARHSLHKDTQLDDPLRVEPALLPLSLESQLVCFVHAERGRGAPPEVMLVHLKAILRDTLNENDHTRESPELREAIVRGAIRAYFAER